MKLKAALALAVLAVLAVQGALPASSAPSVLIVAPANGSLLLNRTANITGTAAGSPQAWVQTSQADFELGGRTNLSVDKAGDLRLNLTLYDDFNDNYLDTSLWTKDEVEGFQVSEAATQLRLKGTSTGAANWSARADVLSLGESSANVSADLRMLTASGAGYHTGIGLYQDPSNSLSFGLIYDPEVLGAGLKVGVMNLNGGVLCETAFGSAVAGPHSFSITFSRGTASLYMDGTLQGTQSVNTTSPRCLLLACGKYLGDSAEAAWDNVQCYFASSGTYHSPAFDTSSSPPSLLQVAWRGEVAGGDALDLSIRSSDNPQMQDPDSWTSLANGQSSGLPAVRRYLQFKVDFSAGSGRTSPLLWDVTVDFRRSVVKVDVSLDGQKTWLPAQGTESWSIEVNLGELENAIWARVTDSGDETEFMSIRVNVDTTPPTGSVLIEGGLPMVDDRRVNLTFTASDAFGISELIFGEDPELRGSAWQDFLPAAVLTLSPGDGEKTIFARFRDRNGWESMTVNDTILLDTSPPEGAVTINGGAEFTKNPQVRLIINASDVSGIAEMMVSNRQDFGDAAWAGYERSIGWNLRSGDGEKKVYARFKDTGGLVSEPVSDTITLDTAPPTLDFSVNGGAQYSNGTNLTLRFEATDNFRVEALMVSTNPTFMGAAWEPFQAERRLAVPASEGQVSLYAKVRDAAENEAPSAYAAIILDLAPPSCLVSSLPSMVREATFTVRWGGSDMVSGVRWYDVQSRDGTGDWTDWLTRTNLTSTNFTGADGHTYSFRARALDNAGNQGAYPATTSNAVLVSLSGIVGGGPEVALERPAPNATVKGTVNLEGTARHPSAGKAVALVQVKVDGGDFTNATGTTDWSFAWDTSRVSDGDHVLQVRAYDGQAWGESLTVRYTVKNAKAPAAASSGNMALVAAAAVALIAAAGAGAFLVLRKRKAGAPPAPERAGAGQAPLKAAKAPGADLQAPRLPRPPAAGAPAAPAPGGGVTGAPAGTGEAPAASSPPEGGPAPSPGPSPAPSGTPASSAEAPGAEPSAPVASETTPEQKYAAALGGIRGLRGRLPGEFIYFKPEELAQLVATGEWSTTPTGEPIVMIFGKWYRGDETNLDKFLTRYQW